jgi:hypothetical protein
MINLLADGPFHPSIKNLDLNRPLAWVRGDMEGFDCLFQLETMRHKGLQVNEPTSY